VTWRRKAEEDLAEAYAHIGGESLDAAERWIRAVEDAVRLLRENSSVGRLRRFRSSRARGVRSWAVEGFPAYLVFYRIDDDELEIVRLLHGARDLPRLLAEDG
jgi:toxin ParE1/3/4